MQRMSWVLAVAIILIFSVAVLGNDTDTPGEPSSPELPLGEPNPPEPTISAEVDREDDWYGQLSARAGYLHVHETDELLVCGMIPVIGWKDGSLEIGMAENGEVFTAITYSVGALSDLGFENFLGEVLDLHVGLWVGRKLDSVEEDDEWNWGALITVVSLDNNEQGATRAQRTRKK